MTGVLHQKPSGSRWMSRPTMAAALLGLLAIVLGIFQLVLVLLLKAAYQPSTSARAGVITVVVLSSVGALIAIRQPKNPIGWLMLSIAICGALIDFPKQYLAYSVHVHPLPGADYLYWLSQLAWVLVFVQLLVVLPILFPDGRLMSRRRLIPIGVGCGLTLLAVVASLDPSVTSPVPNPVGIPALRGASRIMTTAPFAIVFIVTLLSGVASLFVRYRRGDQQQRQQLKWLLAAGLLMVVVLASQLFVPFLQATWLTPLVVTFLPIAIGIAILRYRLYDIDLIINKALVYGGLAALITATYVLVVIGVGAYVGSSRQLLLSIVATVLIAVTFQPVRQRTQQFVNRLVYGKRATPYETLSQFSEHLSETFSQEDILERMARLLAEGTGAERAEVWVRSGPRLLLAASSPQQVSTVELPMSNGTLPALERDRMVPISYQRELLGALTIVKKRGETMQQVEDKLLNDLAAQAGLVLKNVGLNRELLARLDDLRASRQRLVTAQDEERRRLERNIHDGAQQHLVALKVKVGVAEALSEPGGKARPILAQLKKDADEAIENLRELARGIYPPMLASEGLPTALRAHVRRLAFPVEVVADGIPRFSKDTEAAVYFCCLEALQNVSKYANASRAVLRLEREDGYLRFAVSDDGKGFDPSSIPASSGLQNMRDRVEALGGSLTISSQPARGTEVRGELPVSN